MFVIKQHWNNSFIYLLFIYLYVCMQSSDNTTTTLAKNMIGRYRSFKYKILPLLEMYLRYPSYHSVK